ncbi:UNVERIFIED_CONTAM: hypothetical protein RKD50_000114 [Streptomyces canus]
MPMPWMSWCGKATPTCLRPGPPIRRIGQHGLEIVKAVTGDLFIEQEPVGKRITARIALSDIPIDTAARR